MDFGHGGKIRVQGSAQDFTAELVSRADQPLQSTSITLLERVRQQDDSAAWNRFVELYTPLLLNWARQRGLQENDAVDLAQEVLIIARQRLPTFNYDPTLRFRSWLRTIAVNKANEFYRRRKIGNQQLTEGQIAKMVAGSDKEFWEEDYRKQLFARALQIMQDKFESGTWKVALESLTTDRPARELSREFGISESAVYQARSRVLCRLREELKGLWE